MPIFNDINKILVIGAGPIAIGQGCEFDYSGTQASKALKDLGFQVILVNSNAATIMNDPESSDRTYIEPLTIEFLEKIIEKERPHAVLPTVGGQTALNLAVALYEKGIFSKYGVKMIGANVESIKKAEDRQMFKDTMEKIGLRVPKTIIIYKDNSSRSFLNNVLEEIKLPCVIRVSFALGGSGSGIAYNIEDFYTKIEDALASCSDGGGVEVLEYLGGFKEFELEVVCDQNGNMIVVCSIENIDPMGVHTGDSITLAPIMTLTDKEYQNMRNAAKNILDAVGIKNGGANVQFAVNPKTGEQFVIEMNPRVSRSSALASKATGYPIARIAACVAVGMTLDEISSEFMAGDLPVSLEPSIDYIVVKIPKFNFEKFVKLSSQNHNSNSVFDNPLICQELSTSMKSVGEVMSIGGNFREALQKAYISLEEGLDGVYSLKYKTRDFKDLETKRDEILELISLAIPNRIAFICDFIRAGGVSEDAVIATGIDKWFIDQLCALIKLERKILEIDDVSKITNLFMIDLKTNGFSDSRIAYLLNISFEDVLNLRKKFNIFPVYKKVDSCACEFDVSAKYLYSKYSHVLSQEIALFNNQTVNSMDHCESVRCDLLNKNKVIIIGSGPNRIGQGIEFDYSCVHAVKAVSEIGLQSIMINCNPETVSTDHQISDKLYFEPLSDEYILNIINREVYNNNQNELLGVIVQFGGQTGLKIVKSIGHFKELKILGTKIDSLDIAEDRERFKDFLDKFGLLSPRNIICNDLNDLTRMCRDEIGFPVILRPSYVLGGRAMSVIYDESQLNNYIFENKNILESGPILIDEFLMDAIELDVDAIRDGNGDVYIAGIMEHIEEAGIHSGDSNCIIPTLNVPKNIIENIKEITRKIANGLSIIGFINIQFALKNNKIFIIEANPRASRTIPFISKFKKIPFASIATKIICANYKLRDFDLPDEDFDFGRFAVKSPVFPFLKFKDADCILGPEMKSTGESMGIDKTFEGAFIKAFIGANPSLNLFSGNVILSVCDKDKNNKLIEICNILVKNNFKVYATSGTYRFLIENNCMISKVSKLNESRPNILDMILNGNVALYINTSNTSKAFLDGIKIRRAAITHKIPCIRNISAAYALSRGIDFIKSNNIDINSLQDL